MKEPDSITENARRWNALYDLSWRISRGSCGDFRLDLKPDSIFLERVMRISLMRTY